ncbi:hypothetical protein D3C87_1579380 [compost metagenome]
METNLVEARVFELGTHHLGGKLVQGLVTRGVHEPLAREDGHLALLEHGVGVAVPLDVVVDLEALALASAEQGVIVRLHHPAVGRREEVARDGSDL